MLLGVRFVRIYVTVQYRPVAERIIRYILGVEKHSPVNFIDAYRLM